MHTLEGGYVLGYQQVGSQISPPFQYYDKFGDVHELRRARGAGVGTKASDVFGLEDVEDKSDTGSDYSDNCEPVSSKCVGLSKSYATREIELSGSSVTVIMQDASGGAQGPCGLLALGNCAS